MRDMLRWGFRSISPVMVWALLVVVASYASGADVDINKEGTVVWTGFRDSALAGLLAGGMTSIAAWMRLGKTWGRFERTQEDHGRQIAEVRELAGKAHDKIADHVDAWHR